MEKVHNTYDFFQKIPNEEAAIKWFEAIRWKDGRFCPHCGSTKTSLSKKPQPYRCKEKKCRKHFSIKTGVLMQSSNLGMHKWLFAMYLMSISKNGLSSIQLGEKLGIAQEAAWRLGHKIRKSWNRDAIFLSREGGMDITYIGEEERSKCISKKKFQEGRTPDRVVGFSMKQRSKKDIAFRKNGKDTGTLEVLRSTAKSMESRKLSHIDLVRGNNSA